MCCRVLQVPRARGDHGLRRLAPELAEAAPEPLGRAAGAPVAVARARESLEASVRHRSLGAVLDIWISTVLGA